MSRIKKTKERQIAAEVVYGNKLLAKFINNVMLNGKKYAAQRQVYKALENIKTQGLNPVEVFERALSNVGPKMEVRPRRVGGASYQVPMEVRGERRVSLAARWIIESANKRSSKEYKSFAAKLTAELLDAYNNTGEAIKKRDIIYKMAEANKAFSHFRW